MKRIDIVAIRLFLVEVVQHYEDSAPTVARWADDLYIRLGDNPGAVLLAELLTAQQLKEEEQWALSNYAANIVYKQMYALGQDTTGHFGF